MNDARLLWSLLTLALFGLGCSAGGGDACPGAADLGVGTIEATIDGQSWSTETGAYMWAGTSLQIINDLDGGWRLSIVAQADADGTTAANLVDAAAWPAEIPLTTGAEGGFALLYPSSGSSYATEDASGGTLTLQSLDGGELIACFDFDASDGTSTVAVEQGLARLTEFQ